MAGPIYGEGFIDLKPALAGGASGFQAELMRGLGPIGSKIGTLLKSPITLGVAAAVGAGLAAVNLGDQFDAAFDQIRAGTGAVGADLEGLQGDFRAVFGSVPLGMEPVATAITDINRRLGLTGEPLQAIATQILNLTRITGTDLSTNIAEVTRVFGDWGIGTDDQAGKLDALFRASQATGLGVDALSSSLVRYGAPLRQIGFTFEESAAMIGKFEAEGVNADLVLGSLRIALGKMAREGEPAQETFRRVVESIEQAGSVSEANALALELFGARAGPDMAAAIREGRFELGALFDQVSGGTETINTAAADTDDWRESWTVFTNNLKLIVEPIATAVVTGLGGLMGWLTGLIGTVRAAIADPSSGLGQTIRWFGTVFGEVRDIIVGIIDVIREAWRRWGTQITTIATRVFETVRGIVEPIIRGIQAVISTVLALIKGDWEGVWNGVKTLFASVWNTISAPFDLAWSGIKSAISVGLETIRELWDRIWGALSATFSAIWSGIKATAEGAVNGIIDAINWLIGGANRLSGVFDWLMGPTINWGNIPTIQHVSISHAGELAPAEVLRIVQRGELVVPAATTRRLFGLIDDLAAEPRPSGRARAGSLFDGAQFNLYGTPAELAEAVGRRVGLEVRLAT